MLMQTPDSPLGCTGWRVSPQLQAWFRVESLLSILFHKKAGSGSPCGDLRC